MIIAQPGLLEGTLWSSANQPGMKGFPRSSGEIPGPSTGKRSFVFQHEDSVWGAAEMLWIGNQSRWAVPWTGDRTQASQQRRGRDWGPRLQRDLQKP